MVVGVEEVMCLLAAIGTEILVVELLDVRIFMRHAKRLALIFGVEALHPLEELVGLTVERDNIRELLRSWSV